MVNFINYFQRLAIKQVINGEGSITEIKTESDSINLKKG